jgi:hypothetical protein
MPVGVIAARRFLLASLLALTSLTRFPGFLWIIGAGFLLPARRLSQAA